ncbi:unnamed protein product [Rhizophagus irregularis]|nr:unnamed protein product [Rhizophagus irregularis]
MVEYYTDGLLRPSIPISIGKQDPNLVYTDISAAFCVNNEPALSTQANVSLWPLSIHSELLGPQYTDAVNLGKIYYYIKLSLHSES